MPSFTSLVAWPCIYGVAAEDKVGIMITYRLYFSPNSYHQTISVPQNPLRQSIHFPQTVYNCPVRPAEVDVFIRFGPVCLFTCLIVATLVICCAPSQPIRLIIRESGSTYANINFVFCGWGRYMMVLWNGGGGFPYYWPHSAFFLVKPTGHRVIPVSQSLCFPFC